MIYIENITFKTAKSEIYLGNAGNHFSDLIDGRIILAGPKVTLSPDAAQAIGMALHELGTNAGKYGALSTDDGEVEVVWDISPDTDIFTIKWTERNGPKVVPPKSNGFGSIVINQMTTSVLKAEVALDYAPDGVRWTMTCAVADLARAL
ncbi:sensor histidine kinase [Tateyamaria pelophila]|uniref:sensor histidine kinase n=1 Tax=Tateyamaria pelophila TaxID=328415 RepID=UPI001CBF5C05|nr:sensor histidine kinase [Tateyamaria pelophila]